MEFKRKTSSSSPQEIALTESENIVLKAVSAQSEKMSSSEQNKQLEEFAARMSYFEGFANEAQSLDYYNDSYERDNRNYGASYFQGGLSPSDNVNDEMGDIASVHDELGRTSRTEPCKRKAERDDRW